LAGEHACQSPNRPIVRRIKARLVIPRSQSTSGAWRIPLHHWLLLAGLAALFAASGCPYNDAPGSRGGAGEVPLEIAERQLNLGEVPWPGASRHVLELQNRSPRPVEIRGAGCWSARLKLEWRRSVIQPSRSASLDVTLDAAALAQIAAPHTTHLELAVRTDDPLEPEVALRLPIAPADRQDPAPTNSR